MIRMMVTIAAVATAVAAWVGGMLPAELIGRAGADGRPWSSCNVTITVPGGSSEQFTTAVATAAADVSLLSDVTFTVAHPSGGPTVNIVFADHPSPLLQIPGSLAEATSTYYNNVRVGATIVVSPSAIAGLPDTGAASTVQLLRHELLHTLGLYHSHNPASTMAPNLGAAHGISGDIPATLATYPHGTCLT